MQETHVLSSREALAKMIEPIARKFDTEVEWQGENTILSSTAFGGIAGWLNGGVLNGKMSFTYELKMPLRQLLDQLYVST